jgi:hypothetical protein
MTTTTAVLVYPVKNVRAEFPVGPVTVWPLAFDLSQDECLSGAGFLARLAQAASTNDLAGRATG